MTILTSETTVEIFAADQWWDISNRCRAGHTHRFVLKHGYQGQAGVIPEPSSCEIVTAQNDGYLWPDNPMSPLFGYLDVNAPKRMKIPFFSTDFTTTVVNGWPSVTVAGASLTATNNGSGGSVLSSDFQVNSGVGKHSVPTTSAFRQSIYYGVNVADCMQYIDFRLLTANVTGGDIEPANLLFRAGPEGYVMLRVVVKPDETVTLSWLCTNESGTDVNGTDPVETGIVNTGQWLRVAANVEDSRLQAKIYPRDDPEPFEWQLDDGDMLELSDIETFSPHSVFAYAAGGVGVRTGVASTNSNAKPIVVEYDNWSIASVRFFGEVSDYPMVISQGTKDRHSPLRAAGILQRFTQGDQPSISALARTLPLLPDVVAYWSLEDESGYFGSGLSGHPPMIPQQGTPGYRQFSDLKSSSALPKGNGSDWVGVVPPYTFTGSIQFGFVLDLPSGGQPDRSILCRLYTDHVSAKGWNIVYRTGGDLELQAFKSEVDTVYVSSTVNSNMDDGTWYVEFTLENSGSNVEWNVNVRKLEAAGEFMSAGPFTATGLQVQAVNKVWANTSLRTTLAFGHMTLSSSVFDIFAFFDLMDAMDAFEGDTVSERFKRVLAQNDILGSVTHFVDPVGTPFNLMGPQKPLSTSDVMKQAIELDTGGVIYDARSYPGIIFRRRSRLCNQTPKLVLSYADGVIASPFSPKSNTRDLRNRVRVSRIDGGSAVYEKATGRKSIKPPGRGGSGKYETKVDVNARDDLFLTQLAAFRVALVTANGARYPRVTINLGNSAVASDPTILWSLLDLRPGDFIDIIDAQSIFAFDTIRLIVKGYTETITQVEHIFDLDCEPADAYYLFEVENDTLGRFDSLGSTLVEDIDETATAFHSFSPNDVWINTTNHPTKFPFRLELNGEEMVCNGITGTVPTYRATGTAAHADNASVTPGIPGGSTTSGDDLLLITRGATIASDPGSWGSSTGTGWSEVILSGTFRIFRKTFTGSEPAPIVTFPAGSAGNVNSAVITSWHSLGNLIASAAQSVGGGGAQNIPIPEVLGVVPDAVAITMGVKIDDWTSVATRAGTTKIVDSATTVGNDQALVADYVTHNGSANGFPWFHRPTSEFVVTGGTSVAVRSLVLVFGNRQLFDVDRAANGVAKPHNANTEIHVSRTGQFGV